MKAHERWTRLLELLGEEGHLSVNEAVERLDASAATVRRDMDELARQQLLTRTRGGAVAATVSYDLPLRYKTARRADEKQRIARAAAAFIPPGAIVGVNGGTTTSEVARELATRADPGGTGQGEALTLVTNAINIANELAVRPHIKTVLTGGVARPSSYELTGPLATTVLEHLALDYAVLGVNAVHPHFGAACHDEGEASVNRAIADRAAAIIVVADATKLGRRAFAQVCPVGSITRLVTDTEAPDDVVAQFTAQNIEVIRV
ncbi:DeoR/GlpR family DNA-binding transcription regulator [Streptomyces sp. ODS05-4]|uniref:DeoR/GlpR family DNA-binding transcription regulator n=1 Tax=Streptomyces sp. ODS05-4 TaxID=2944939 RepID=UPI002109C3D3|nr:DeoR/GlpR family DNA-binding transcription regulator [Streptomyces sp. ODS05-4]